MSQSKQREYDSMLNDNGVYSAIPKQSTEPKLPSGVYELFIDQRTNQLLYKASSNNHDELIDLPGTEYDTVVSEFEHFMKPETKQAFEEYGFLYKRSTLLYGVPGTGKTCIVNRVASKVVEQGGVVLLNPAPRLVAPALEEIQSLNKNAIVMVIFEEMDRLVITCEDELLNLLDGEVQKENVMYLSTTNYIEKVPKRIQRPGRFSSVLEIKTPSEAARRHYLNIKLKNPSEEELDLWTKSTDGLSIDEVSECVRAVKCLGYDLDRIIARIKKVKNGGQDLSNYPEDEEDEDDFGMFQGSLIIPSHIVRD